MDILYHRQVDASELPSSAIAETYITFIKIRDIKRYAEALISEITDTSWISKLDPIARMSYEEAAIETINNLVEKFQAIDDEVTSSFGEFMISLSSGQSLKVKNGHQVLPISELWKEKIGSNHGFDFHTISAMDRYSFGEAKYVSTGNSYGSAASQVVKFIKKGKDRRDAVHLVYLGSPIALTNLQEGRRGFIVAFSINSKNYTKILTNALTNEHILELTQKCDELYIIGVQA